MRRSVVSCAVSFVVGGATFALASPDVIRTKRLEIVDRDDHASIVAFVDAAGPRLDVGEPKGRGVTVRVDDVTREATITVRDAQGQQQCLLAVMDTGAARFVLGRPDGRQIQMTTDDGGAAIEMLSGGRANLRMGAKDGGVLVALGGQGEGGDVVIAASEDGAKVDLSFAGKRRLLLGVGADGAAGVRLHDESGAARLEMAVAKDGPAGIVVRDAAGEPLSRYGVDEKGNILTGGR